jgi:hypothetical protein
MSNKPRPPLTLPPYPKETKSTITLCINLTPIQHKPLRDRRLHFRDSPRCVGIDVSADAVAAVHYEGAIVHAPLRSGDEVQMVCTASPGCVDVGVGVEYGLEILPFAGVAAGFNRPIERLRVGRGALPIRWPSFC